MKQVVLIGSAGTATAFGAATALRRHWSTGVGIVAMDINPRELVTTSLLADAFEQVPLTRDPAFPERLLGIIDLHGVTTYLPLLPDEIQIASAMCATGRLPPSVKVLAPSPEISEITCDKLLTACWLEAHGLPAPRTAAAATPFQADRYFAKPRIGTGSRGATVVEASALKDHCVPEATSWIVQEVCEPPEVTVDAFHDSRTGAFVAVARERIEIKLGVTTKARLFSDDHIVEAGSKLARTLPLQGSFCFQVMRRANRWVIIDINPRPGGASAMCALTGNDFFAAHFALAWRQDTGRFFRPVKADTFVTRQYAEFLMS